MSRTAGIAWTATILLAAVWPLWEDSRRHEPRTSAPVAPPRARPQLDPRELEDGVRAFVSAEDALSRVEESREEDLPREAEAPLVATPDASTVRVHGQVRRGGQPIAGCDLAFRSQREGLQNDDDWDFTDVDGRYEIQLPAGRYAVWSGDDAESWLTDLVVPAGVEELVLDVDLPF